MITNLRMKLFEAHQIQMWRQWSRRAVWLNVMPRLCSHSHQPNNLSCKLKLTSHLLKLQNTAPPEKLNQIQKFFHYGYFPTKTFYVDIFFYTNANFILVKFWNKSLQISMLRRKCALIFLLDIYVHISCIILMSGQRGQRNLNIEIPYNIDPH